MRRGLLLVAALSAASALWGCGEKSETTALGPPRPLMLALPGPASGMYGGIYAAQAEGDFGRGDLAVRVRYEANGPAALSALKDDQADVAVASEPDLIAARAGGAQFVAVGALVQQPLEAIISLGNHPIRNAAQLSGQTVATPGTALASAELDAVLRNAGIEPASVRHIAGGPVPTQALLKHRATAAIGGFWNYDAVSLELRRLRPVSIRIAGVGVPQYSQLVLVVRVGEAHEDGPLLRAFLQALTRGVESARTNPAAATAPLLAANPGLNRAFELGVLQRTLTVSFPAKAGEPFGFQDPSAWQAFGSWLLAHGVISRPPDAGVAVTDEFLPGQGE